jgi:hypothetical protein
MPREFANRPDCEQAHTFQCSTCSDPDCGLHLIAYRANDKPICEIVIGRESVRGLLALIHDLGLDL